MPAIRHFPVIFVEKIAGDSKVVVPVDWETRFFLEESTMLTMMDTEEMMPEWLDEAQTFVRSTELRAFDSDEDDDDFDDDLDDLDDDDDDFDDEDDDLDDLDDEDDDFEDDDDDFDDEDDELDDLDDEDDDFDDEDDEDDDF